MRVIATKMGFYGGSRVHVGQVFDVPDGVTGKWFAPEESDVQPDEPKPTKIKPTKPKANDPHTFSEIARRDEDTQNGAA